MWIAWAGLVMFWIAGFSWMAGFGRLMNLDNERDGTAPIHAIYVLNVVLCGSAVVEAVLSIVFISYGVVWIQ